MKIIKKGLDELQKQILSGIESRGFWIAFWGSLILLIVQMIFANNIISVISSWLLFMVLAIYEAVSCLKAGIWNSSLYISKKRNAFMHSFWRRMRDLNPRGPLRNPNGLANRPLQPLG